MAAPTYDKERSKEELGKLTGIDADEERRIEEAAHSAHNKLKDREDKYGAPAAPEKNVSPDALSEAEQTNNGMIGGGYRDEDQQPQGKGGGLKVKVKGLFTKKRVAIGGGILSGLVILAIMAGGFSAFELINLRENSLSHGNRYMNRVLQKRRAQTFGHMIQEMNDKKLSTADQKKFKDAYEKHGFILKFDGEGKLAKFSFEGKDGTVRDFELNSDDDLKATNDFFSDKGIGLEASKALDKVHASTAGTWRGPGAKIVYSLYKFAFFNWLDTKPSDKAKTPRQKFADVFRKSNATEQALTATGTKSKQDLGDGETSKDANGNEVTTAVTDTAEVLNGELNNNLSPEEYQKKMLENPALTDSVLGVASDANVQDLVDGTNKAMQSGGIKTEEQLNNLGKGFFKGSFSALLKGFNAVGIAQEACEVKGILNFVGNYRNIVLSIELARFAIRILNAADDQKAGIVTGEGLNLLMIYLTTPNPKTGKGHTGAGGEQFMMGDTGARPSKLNKSLYGVGRNNDGILGSISNFVNQIPGIDHCNIVNNGFVTAGGFAVGIVAAIGTSGAETAANIATILTLAAMHEIVVNTATPMLIKAGAHMIGSGYENGEQAGDMYASGFDALSGMVGGASGTRPSTNAQIIAMDADVEAYEHSVIADQSVFERYLSPSNNDSLATHVAMAMPSSFHAAAISFSSGLTGFMQHVTSFSALGYLMPGSSKKALALDSGCTDPQAKQLNIATDPFCNPIMASAPKLNLHSTEAILKQNKQIDDQGNPTSEKAAGDDKSFTDYAALCFSGRPGILYNPTPDKEGNEKTTEDACTQHGAPLPGDSVGRYDRFASWYGYKNDKASIEDQLGLTSGSTEPDFVKTIN